jgi:hypothetical protein
MTRRQRQVHHVVWVILPAIALAIIVLALAVRA